jgi:hypothetical protein
MKVLLSVLALALAGTASADTLWTYTGNDMNGNGLGNLGPPFSSKLAPDCHCALTGTFTLDTTLTDINNTPISWNFSDGTHTLDRTDSIASFHASGLNGWYLSVTSSTVHFLSVFYGSQIETTDSVVVDGKLWAIAESNHGFLTETSVPPLGTTVPEPGTGMLLGIAICSVILIVLLHCWKFPSVSIPSRRVV